MHPTVGGRDADQTHPNLQPHTREWPTYRNKHTHTPRQFQVQVCLVTERAIPWQVHLITERAISWQVHLSLVLKAFGPLVSLMSWEWTNRNAANRHLELPGTHTYTFVPSRWGWPPFDLLKPGCANSDGFGADKFAHFITTSIATASVSVSQKKNGNLIISNQRWLRALSPRKHMTDQSRKSSPRDGALSASCLYTILMQGKAISRAKMATSWCTPSHGRFLFLNATGDDKSVLTFCHEVIAYSIPKSIFA